MRVLNAAQMREADRRTIEEIGLPSLVLMENAGRQVVAAMEASFEDLADERVAVLCGRGNNGGDGFVVARTLHLRGVDVTPYLLGRVEDVRGDARVNLEILGRLGVPVVEIPDAHAWELHFSAISRCDVIVDAIFGTGFRGRPSGLLETVIADVNSTAIPVVAIDLPSGLSADSPAVEGDSILASITVALAAPKLSLVLPPAEARAGDLLVVEIGIPRRVIEALEGPWTELLTRDEVRRLVVPRPAESHKGDYGRVLVVAGSVGRTGAAHLAALGALRSGAGLVTVATPRSCLPVIAALAPEYMTLPLEEAPGGSVDASALGRLLEARADVIAVGPGLGTEPGAVALVRGLVERASVPLVLDADALNAFAGAADRLVGRDGVDVVITPHPGEMARLVGLSIEGIEENRLEVAREFARSHRVYVVLKGYRTIVATPEGRAFINPTGNPGMATGGTGDVLTGVIAAWLGQLLDAEAACKLGVYLHGLAGDLAAEACSETAMTAGDLAARLGEAMRELTRARAPQGEKSA
ncbi:MAG TPA: NAD(P)H-hydrate dehydratase [Vicinamibacterales bacterium]|nr:NAD(P)H-hydrate dehydratase [Vicinamibacterales bacterium]